MKREWSSWAATGVLAIAMIFAGTLSDALGRKTVMTASLAAAAAAGRGDKAGAQKILKELLELQPDNKAAQQAMQTFQ